MKKKTGSVDQWIQFIGKDKLQTFQDNFARAYGVSMIFLDMDGNPLTVGSQNSLFCFMIPPAAPQKAPSGVLPEYARQLRACTHTGTAQETAPG